MKQYFVDTNVVVYANDGRSRAKQDRAIETITRLMHRQNGVISFQVMQEYANTALLKLKQAPNVVLRQLNLLQAFRVVLPFTGLVRRQIEIRETYRIGFWDAGIVAAAEEAQCDVILSEDLSEGQLYAGIELVNPFAKGFDSATLSN